MATAWGSLESDSRAMAAALYHIYSGLVTLARHKQGQSERHKPVCASEFRCALLSCTIPMPPCIFWPLQFMLCLSRCNVQ